MRRLLLPGEQVIVVTRPQPRTLILPSAAFIAVPALGAFAMAWIVKGEAIRLLPFITAEWTVWLVGGCALIVGWILCGYCLTRTLRWQATRYTLTSHRILAKYGMFHRREWQVPLAAVRNVWLQQSILQRVLRSGNISLDTGHAKAAVLEDVPEAEKFRNFVLEAMDDLPGGTIDGADAVEGQDDGVLPWKPREGGRDERWQ
jgi:uncharacterized membrane protein YdbT with pleckstrin-like domain